MKKEKLRDAGRRKKMLVLPLLVIPFLTMGFWALGGGRSGAGKQQEAAGGLNLQLPNAQLKDDKGENKMSYYEAAEKDSVKWKKGIENDPIYSSPLDDPLGKEAFSYDPGPLQGADYSDPNEQKVYQKLAELNRQLQSRGSADSKTGKSYRPSAATDHSWDNSDAERLHQLMQKTGTPATSDPEVDQLNGMMDRILDIQHPERIRQRLEEKSAQKEEAVFPVRTNGHTCTISLLDTSYPAQQPNSFYSVNIAASGAGQNAIAAVIHETQTLVNGSIIKIRLLDDVAVEGSSILKGSFIFGKAALEGERLKIDISSIRNNNSLFPVKLAVYDVDGMEGIHIPGSITRDVAGQSAGNSLQQIEMGSFDPSIKAQATTAGINAAKTLLARKAKLVRVTVKAGYRILLKANSH